MRLYLSGPMTGQKDFGRPAFEAATAALRAMGHFVVSPVELDFEPKEAGQRDADTLWRAFLIRDVAVLLTSHFDAIAVLPGWQRSKGARLEVLTAIFAGMMVVDAETLERVRVYDISTWHKDCWWYSTVTEDDVVIRDEEGKRVN